MPRNFRLSLASFLKPMRIKKEKEEKKKKKSDEKFSTVSCQFNQTTTKEGKERKNEKKLTRYSTINLLMHINIMR